MVDGVVAGIGIQPNVAVAQAAGLAVDNGIVVDEFLRTGARTSTQRVGRNMAGAAEPNDHLPFFHSDLFELGYESVRELDSRLETFADWMEPFREEVLYYLQDGRVRGVLLWNVWKPVPAAEFRQQHVLYSNSCEGVAQRGLIEVRVFAGGRKAPHIRHGFDRISAKQLEELVEGSSAVPDRPKGQPRITLDPPMSHGRP